MKRRTISIMVFAAAFLLICSARDQAFAANEEENAACSMATMKGSYGFYRTGYNEEGPYAAVGILFCDGNGKCKRRQAVSFNGQFVRNTASFDYQLAPDCTGKFTADGVEFAAIVAVENGNELYILHENNQTVYGVYKRIHQ